MGTGTSRLRNIPRLLVVLIATYGVCFIVAFTLVVLNRLRMGDYLQCGADGGSTVCGFWDWFISPAIQQALTWALYALPVVAFFELLVVKYHQRYR